MGSTPTGDTVAKPLVAGTMNRVGSTSYAELPVGISDFKCTDCSLAARSSPMVVKVRPLNTAH